MKPMTASINNYVAKIEGICGGEGDIIITLVAEEQNAAIAKVIERCIVKKSVTGLMFELEFQGVTFRLFRSGRIVLRGIKNKKTLNRLLSALLL